MTDLKQHDIIQIIPSHKWGGCLAVVSEVKSWGCLAYVAIPNNTEPAGRAYIRLNFSDFESVGAPAIFAPDDKEDNHERQS